MRYTANCTRNSRSRPHAPQNHITLRAYQQAVHDRLLRLAESKDPLIAGLAHESKQRIASLSDLNRHIAMLLVFSLLHRVGRDSAGSEKASSDYVNSVRSPGALSVSRKVQLLRYLVHRGVALSMARAAAGQGRASR